MNEVLLNYKKKLFSYVFVVKVAFSSLYVCIMFGYKFIVNRLIIIIILLLLYNNKYLLCNGTTPNYLYTYFKHNHISLRLFVPTMF